MPCANSGGSFFEEPFFEPLQARRSLARRFNDRRTGRQAPVDDDIARAQRAKKGSPFLSTEQAGFYLGLSARKMQELRVAGTGPRFRRHSRYIRYHIDDLDSWSAQSGIRSQNG